VITRCYHSRQLAVVFHVFICCKHSAVSAPDIPGRVRVSVHKLHSSYNFSGRFETVREEDYRYHIRLRRLRSRAVSKGQNRNMLFSKR
jgi:hypothetical protein